VRFVWGKIIFSTNLYFRYKQCLQNMLNKRRENYEGKAWKKIKAMMEELMSKFDEIISGQGVLSRKENEVEMPSIKATVNDENMGDNSKEKRIMMM